MIKSFHIAMAMKPTEGNFVENAKKHGVTGINIDASRVETGEVRAKSEVDRSRVIDGNAWRAAGTLCGMKTVGTTTEGRWPTNVIHDGDDDIVKLFPKDNSGSMARVFYEVKEYEEGEGEEK